MHIQIHGKVYLCSTFQQEGCSLCRTGDIKGTRIRYNKWRVSVALVFRACPAPLAPGEPQLTAFSADSVCGFSGGVGERVLCNWLGKAK